MKTYIFLLPFIVLACVETNEQTSTDVSNNPLKEYILKDSSDQPLCPEGHHADSILEIVYGMPDEELFAQSDSGLIALGGCEISDETHYCQKHQLSFIHP